MKLIKVTANTFVMLQNIFFLQQMLYIQTFIKSKNPAK